jgi:hypothetical protein
MLMLDLYLWSAVVPRTWSIEHAKGRGPARLRQYPNATDQTRRQTWQETTELVAKLDPTLRG